MPAVADQVASTIATEFVHTPPADGPVHYRVLAVDQSGNPSPSP